ncbi:hypothetical protein K461DRAFT_271164 [Myriangium duriaei CBS 260.36]|uniref:Uncharacterized protein n=1 Tax=Myriangium duriaei CBS 260.36 TaxID=1168546 RepID=A0A9P4IW54_9PEZI|nr:hypothetical protein K461DRAFT_271164 [Myriangium duriaei CBS 260.36]
MELDTLLHPRSRQSLRSSNKHSIGRDIAQSHDPRPQNLFGGKDPLSELHHARGQGCTAAESFKRTSPQSPKQYSPYLSSTTGKKENQRFRRSGTERKGFLPEPAPLKHSLEISKVRPKSNLKNEIIHPQDAPVKPQYESSIPHKRTKSTALGRRVLSRVTAGVLRSKSISKRIDHQAHGQTTQGNVDDGTKVLAKDNSSQISVLIDDGEVPIHPTTDSSLSKRTQYGDPPQFNRRVVRPRQCDRPAGSAVLHLHVKTSPDITTICDGQDDFFWVAIQLTAIAGGVWQHPSYMLDHQSNNNLVITNASLKLKISDGFQALKMAGTTYRARMAVGESFTAFAKIKRIADGHIADGHNAERQHEPDADFEELCSEIETMLGPSHEEVEVFSVKVRYSCRGLPADTSLVLKHSFRLPHDNAALEPREFLREKASSDHLKVASTTIGTARSDEGSPRPSLGQKTESFESLNIRHLTIGRDSKTPELGRIVKRERCREEEGEHRSNQGHGDAARRV